MYVVAIVADVADPQVDAEELARRLGDGTTALELRLALSAVPPAVLLRTPSRGRAEQTARVLSAGHRAAVAVDLADVVPVERMVHVRRFALDATRLHADARGPALAYEDITAILHVAAETSVLRTTREKEIDPTRGRRTEVEVEHTRTERTVEHALFLLGRADTVPWVLRASEARYLTLGAALRPTSMENFLVVLAFLRERAPRALYDERFALQPIVRHAQAQVRGHDTASPELGDAAVDVRVHLLGRTLLRSKTDGPYR
jgi:hypothetical protein